MASVPTIIMHYPDPDGLKPRERAFVEAYLDRLDKDCYSNGQKAAIKAGYKAKYARKTAARLIASKRVGNVIAKRQQNQSLKADITFEWVADKFKDIVEATEDDKTRISALSELNKMYGYQAPAKSINVHTGLNELLVAHNISKDELMLKHDKEY